MLAALLLCGAPVACGAPQPGDVPRPAADEQGSATQAPAPSASAADVAPPPSPTPPSGRVPTAAPPQSLAAPPSGPPAADAAAADAAPLYLADLERRLRETRALGPLTKLALKNDIDDLVADVRAFHAAGRGDLSRLRERFELLVMKLLSLLQDRDSELADQIARSRDALWSLLSDPRAFAQLSERK